MSYVFDKRAYHVIHFHLYTAAILIQEPHLIAMLEFMTNADTSEEGSDETD